MSRPQLFHLFQWVTLITLFIWLLGLATGLAYWLDIPKRVHLLISWGIGSFVGLSIIWYKIANLHYDRLMINHPVFHVCPWCLSLLTKSTLEKWFIDALHHEDYWLAHRLHKQLVKRVNISKADD